MNGLFSLTPRRVYFIWRVLLWIRARIISVSGVDHLMNLALKRYEICSRNVSFVKSGLTYNDINIRSGILGAAVIFDDFETWTDLVLSSPR